MKEKPNLKPRSLTRISAISADQLRRTFDPKDQPVPDDWLYVNNFEDSDKPRALRLPAGIGCQFQKDMERLVENLETNVPNAFEGEEYQKEQERIQEKLQESREQVFENLEGKAQEKNFTFKSDR